MNDNDAFMNGLLQAAHTNGEAYDALVIEMRTYRNKFVAHLDDEERMQIPVLTIPVDSTMYLYRYLLDVENDVDAFPDAPRDPQILYAGFVEEARAVYAPEQL